MLKTIWNEMFNGNFSFAILVVCVLQLVVTIAHNRKRGGGD